MNPQEEKKQENNVPTPKPVAPITVPVAPVTIPVAPTNIPEPKKGASGNDFFIRPLRTYEDDVKNAVQKDSISTAKILMAEQQKRQIEKNDFEENSPKSETNVVKIVASIILVLLGIGIIGGGAYYYFQKKAFEIPQQVTILTSNNFLDTENLEKISVDNKTNREVVGEIRKIINNSSDMKEGTLKEIKLVKTVVTTENGKEFSKEVELSTDEFWVILEAREPDALARSLDQKFLLGVHKTKTSVEPFITLKTNDYEISYAKMLEWEWVLVSDIQDIFYKNLGSSQAFLDYEENNNLQVQDFIVIDASSSTTTVTDSTQNSTTTLSKYEARNFKDLILANKDTRSILDTAGKILFFYSFVDRKNLIMTTNGETLNLLIGRLTSTQLIR
jgi:hypothetical protein